MPIRPLLLAPILSLFSAGLAAAPPDSPEAVREAGRALPMRFAAALKEELTGAMEKGGPSSAIDVCGDRARRIADELARGNGVKIGRTSLRFRNPQNAPADWQRPVLERFGRSKATAGDDEWLETLPARGVAARYMQAIPTQPLCLACHGKPEDPVRAQLERVHPYDRATGYETGDIRGAFYVEWPLPPAPTAH